MRLVLGVCLLLAGCDGVFGITAFPRSDGGPADDATGADTSGPPGDGSSTCVTAHMIVMLEPGATLPAGWKCVSCGATDPLRYRFPIGAASFGTQGGASSHAHTFTVTSVGLPSHLIAIENGNSGGSGFAGNPTHDGAIAGSTAMGDHTPPYRDLELIEPLAEGTPLPAGAIIMLGESTIPGGFEPYTAEDGKFMRAGDVAASGGSALHTHNVTLQLPDSNIDNVPRQLSMAGLNLASGNHSHLLADVISGPNDPPHVVVRLARATAPVAPPGSMLALFDLTPGAPWAVQTMSGGPLSGVLLVAGASTNLTAEGSKTHAPANLVDNTQTPSTNPVDFAPGSFLANAADHSHQVTVQFAPAAQLPPYTEVIIAQLAPGGCP